MKFNMDNPILDNDAEMARFYADENNLVCVMRAYFAPSSGKRVKGKKDKDPDEMQNRWFSGPLSESFRAYAGDIDEVYLALRDVMLRNLNQMERFCSEHPEFKFSDKSITGRNQYGFTVKNGDMKVYVRLIPQYGDYCCYMRVFEEVSK